MTPDTTDNYAGQLIRTIRKHLGDSQAEFAERLGRKQSWQAEVSKYERGEVYPGPKVQKEIAALIECPHHIFDPETREGETFKAGVRFAVRSLRKQLAGIDSALGLFLRRDEMLEAGPESFEEMD